MTTRILFTGGGTAGHVTPNITLIEHCLGLGWDVSYIGEQSGIEHQLIAPLDIPFHSISSGKLRRYFSWQNFIDPFKVLWGVLQSLVLLLKLKPDVVFSKGGFVAVPVVVASWLLRIPAIAHESDITPGLANRISYPLCRRVCLTFEQSLKYLKGKKSIVTGTPVRVLVKEGDALKGREFLGFEKERAILLVFGGSLGAQAINEATRTALPRLTQFNVVHVVGEGNLAASLQSTQYRQYEFVGNEFGDVLAAADLVVSRAGANSLYELLLLRKPHLLVPLTAAASRGDQLVNARVFNEAGYSHVLSEDSLNAESLIAALQSLDDHASSIRERLEAFPILNSTELIMQEINALRSR